MEVQLRISTDREVPLVIARCGLDCRECYAYPEQCPGCEAVVGKPFWTEEVGGETCFIYKCCADKAHAHCGRCDELPCKAWYELKDPSLSDEEHLRMIEQRANVLRRLDVGGKQDA